MDTSNRVVQQDDYERCVAAHYVARHQDTLADTLEWNQRALRHAQAVGDERVAGFLASLHLNLGKSCEDVNEDAEAAAQYALAEQSLAAVPDGDYGDIVRGGVAAARARLRATFVSARRRRRSDSSAER